MKILLLLIGLGLGLAVIALLMKLSKHIEAVDEDMDRQKEPNTAWEEKLGSIKNNLEGYNYLAGGMALVLILIVIYYQIAGTPYEGHFREWLNLVVRLAHVTFGIAWIGASFYFVFLENALNRTKDVREELAGNLWAVHGGGFYYLEKYKVAPTKIPKDLHWFKYEAYFTWISGFCLLCVVYYFNAKGFLIDPNVLDISPVSAIAIGVSSLVVGWLIYAYLSKSPLAKNVLLFATVGFLILVFFAWFYCQVFSARAAFIHFGALIGTLMVGNVFFVIIPAQKEMVSAAKEGRPLNPELGKHAGWRSLHNNYFTLPVLFVMISNHFPSTFGNEYNWAVLAGISLGTAGIKHYLNLLEKKQESVWVLPISVFLLLAVVFVTAPEVSDGECKEEVAFTTVYAIINERCISCHSAQPTDDVWTSPPNGVMYDTPEQIANLTEKIMQRVVITKTMPQNNKTGMTPEERELIRCWIEQGANL
ncbi:MAG: membrane protein [Saprospiraceae bacterium]|nr:MAG: membrane protein [Saprospiraceae bacterium]